MKTRSILLWIAQGVAAIIFIQTLYFKFTGNTISIELFTILGVEPWGRYLIGIIELITGILLFIPRTAAIGGILGLFIGIGAIATHILFIGIRFGGDISLFALAITVTILCGLVVYFRRNELKI